MMESTFWGRHQMLDVSTGQTVPLSLDTIEPFGYFIYKPLTEEKLQLSHIIRALLSLSKKDFFGLGLFLLFMNLVMLALPVLTGVVLDWTVPYADYSLLAQIFLALVLAVSLIYVASLGETNIFSRIKSRSTIYAQLGIWERVLQFPLSFFRRYEIGDLSLRVRGLDLINQQISFSIITFLSGVVYTILGFCIISFYSIEYAVGIFFIGLFLGALFFYTSYKQLIFSREVQKLQAKIQSLLYQGIANIHKIKIAKAEDRVEKQWRNTFLSKIHFSVKARIFAIVFQTLIAFLTLLTLMLVYVFVFSAKDLSIGSGIMLISLSFQLMGSITGWMTTLSNLVQLLPYYERMRPLMEQVPEQQQNLMEFSLKGAMKAENLSFLYPDSTHKVMQNVSFTIHPGQFIAFVGPSGGGKSTLLRLMLGLEKPTEGEMLIDDIPLTQMSLQHFRSQVGVVLQRPSFIPGNIFDNLSLFEKNVSHEQIWDVLEKVSMKADIEALPMGLLTLVSELGRTFSSGQMQRLMIARALIKNPKILLLDEPTSALDAISQQKIIHTLQNLPLTKVVVTHRLSTIEHADIIYVVEKGRLSDQGTFSTLLKKSSLFRQLAILKHNP
jgi:ABC-type bacteriocin/lantibiotic exporter with double-glycine peptidase domain